MTDMTPQMKAWLGSARTALEPSLEDAQRVHVQVAASLHHAQVKLEALEKGSTGTGSAGIGSATPRAIGLRNVGLVCMGLSIGGLVGYRVGLSRPPIGAPAPALVAAPNQTSAVPPVQSVPRVTGLNPPPEDPLELEPKAVAAISSRPRAPLGTRLNSSPTSSTDDQEVFQVQRVERALRADNAQLALSLLEQLDTASPHGRLHQERSAARTLAHCMLRYTNVALEVERFERQYPNSVHVNRLRQACVRK